MRFGFVFAFTRFVRADYLPLCVECVWVWVPNSTKLSRFYLKTLKKSSNVYKFAFGIMCVCRFSN